MGFPGGSVINNPPAMHENPIQFLGWFPGERNGNPLQYSCLKNPMDRGAWNARVHRIMKSQTQLKWLSIITDNSNYRKHSVPLQLVTTSDKGIIMSHFLSKWEDWLLNITCVLFEQFTIFNHHLDLKSNRNHVWIEILSNFLASLFIISKKWKQT